MLGQLARVGRRGEGGEALYGHYESLGAHVAPRSLYIAQMRDRLGEAALKIIADHHYRPPELRDLDIDHPRWGLAASRDEARAQLASARADLELKESELKRIRRAIETKAVSELDLENFVYNIVANLTGPIFTGGQRRADVEAARARAEQAAASYAGAVLEALREVEEALVDRYYELALRAGNRRALGLRFEHVIPTEERAARIRSLAQPTLILWGGRDRLIPIGSGNRFAADIEGSRMVVFADLGHVPHEEAPAETVAAVQEFLAALR